MTVDVHVDADADVDIGPDLGAAVAPKVAHETSDLFPKQQHQMIPESVLAILAPQGHSGTYGHAYNANLSILLWFVTAFSLWRGIWPLRTQIYKTQRNLMSSKHFMIF